MPEPPNYIFYNNISRFKSFREKKKKSPQYKLCPEICNQHTCYIKRSLKRLFSRPIAELFFVLSIEKKINIYIIAVNVQRLTHLVGATIVRYFRVQNFVSFPHPPVQHRMEIRISYIFLYSLPFSTRFAAQVSYGCRN